MERQPESQTEHVSIVTLGDNKEYLIQDVINIYWKGEDEVQKYYGAEGFYVLTQDGVNHYVERDELSVHDEKLLDRWVNRVFWASTPRL
ncbi:MAG: hypothetical protein KME05_22200 [Gloeocapsa sp. UFS-A4-WI-NPMV-4B04]|jgi:hypothetical protein|nr:hypothetical protein [Gloeocapsa sp. UFS-A4-WI-NPMV-4B04]